MTSPAATPKTPLPTDLPPSQTPNKKLGQNIEQKTAKPAATAAPTAQSLLAPRYIPGAPPPEPVKEKRKRKKKTNPDGSEAVSDAGDRAKDDTTTAVVSIADPLSAALVDTAPAQTDVEAGRVATELVASEKEITELVEEEGNANDLVDWKIFKKSAALDALRTKIGKLEARLEKALQKPPKTDVVARVKAEQKPIVETPAYLENVIQEFRELKTTIEEEEAKRRSKQEQSLREHRLADRIAHQRALTAQLAAQEAHSVTKAEHILTFLSLAANITSPSPQRPFTAPLTDSEKAALVRASHALVEDDTHARTVILHGLLNENSRDSFAGVPFSRFRSLMRAFSHPTSPVSSPTPGASFVSVGHPDAASFSMQFTTFSDLEDGRRPLSFGNLEDVHGIAYDETDAKVSPDPSAEIINGPPIPSAAAIQQEWVEVKPVSEPSSTTRPTGTEQESFDWAADDMDGDLPPLDTLHAKFGTSGQATPVSAIAPVPERSPLPPQDISRPVLPPVNTAPSQIQGDEDWITPHPIRSRVMSTPVEFAGRGRARGDFRGSPRGGDRGFRGRGGSGFRGGRGGGFPPSGEFVTGEPRTPLAVDADEQGRDRDFGGEMRRGRGSGFRGRGDWRGGNDGDRGDRRGGFKGREVTR